MGVAHLVDGPFDGLEYTYRGYPSELPLFDDQGTHLYRFSHIDDKGQEFFTFDGTAA